jgi:hypothetical protein
MAPAALLHACATALVAGDTFEAAVGELTAALLLSGEPVESTALARPIHSVIVSEGWRAGGTPPSVLQVAAAVGHFVASCEPLGIVVGRGWTERRLTNAGRYALHVGLRTRALGPSTAL